MCVVLLSCGRGIPGRAAWRGRDCARHAPGFRHCCEGGWLCRADPYAAQASRNLCFTEVRVLHSNCLSGAGEGRPALPFG